jgi:hypothetical protein
MTITIDPKIEKRRRELAEAEGLTVAAYIERLVNLDQSAVGELEGLAIDGLNSGEPIEVCPGYWEAKHRLLDARTA